ncbi:putative F-box/FBD/LRR-repeat protein At1g66290 isoform X2 [Malania oleifera]|uniref:putative F-box/FBD/LRR-repeat protein At1g66290 isoform X2 n=1 Tax=Malania oleifera TaxID=397392 RepID=UPI0025AE30AD|nr:putative F-box/FBD/LRR-repeat protein At1g66290 isoform X2 [Malania oleifera]
MSSRAFAMLIASFIFQHVRDLVEGISNVGFLYLSAGTLQTLEIAKCCLPTFSNLIHLGLGTVNYNGWELVLKLLNSSSNLEVLLFSEGFLQQKDFDYHLPNHVPTCLSLHLEELEIEEFHGRRCELQLVKFVLASAEVLRKITIDSSMSMEKELLIAKRLLTFPRCSEICQIKLLSKYERK